MKYHFQYVSKTAVRIELIAEDKRETLLIEKLALAEENDLELHELFRKGVAHYDNQAMLLKLKFMNFPKVALCSHHPINQQVEDVA